MKTILFVIANHGYQDVEYGTPRKMLEDVGIRITVAAGSKGKCIGKFGGETAADFSLSEVSGGEYDVVVFIGGPGVIPQYQGDQEYLRLAKEANILAAICIAPAVISDSGVFRGKKVTGWDKGGEQKAHIEANGGMYTGESVTVDGMIITADGPDSAEAFGQEILRALQE